MKYQVLSNGIKHQVAGIKIKNKFNVKLIVFVFFVLTTLYSILNTSNAQTATSSPYSRYGIGDVTGKSFSQNFAMGGTNIAIQNDTSFYFFINRGNPASYSNMRLTTAELGVNYNRVLLQNASTQKTINSASLAYVSIAFPFYKKWWGASIGLAPFSSVGYRVSDHQDITNIGSVDYLYEGKGGIDQLYFGNGIKPLYKLPTIFASSAKYARLNSAIKPDKTKKTCIEVYKDYRESKRIMNTKKLLSSFAIGANASYLFGNFEISRRSIFPGSTNAFNTRAVNTTRISDVYFDYGMQMAYTVDSVRRKNLIKDAAGLYRKDSCRPYKFRDLKENVKFLFGINFAAQTNVRAKIDSLSYSYFTTSTGYEVVKDTIEDTQNTSGKITLPLSFGIGLGFKKGEKLLVAADFAIQNWSNYQAFNQSQGLKNSMRVSLGAQYIPDPTPNSVYYKRIHYRIGVRYLQTALELKNTPLTEYAGSIGLGFPVGRNFLMQNFSMVNIGVEVGQRGTTTNGLIRENFIRATIGFTINDRWFVKPKFD